MPSPENKFPGQLPSNSEEHRRYLLGYYRSLGEAIKAGELTPEKFALEQTEQRLELERLADHDPLVTSFLNINGLKKELELLRRTGNLQGTMAAFDVDKLGEFNLAMGHLAGNALILLYAQIIAENTPEGIWARIGGDEFNVFMVGINLNEAFAMAEQVRVSIARRGRTTFPNFRRRQSMSIGLTGARSDDDVEQLIYRADQALREAKKARNRIVTK